jgi:hypothetical protein
VKFNVVKVESVVLCIVGEECRIVSLSSSFLE